MSKVFIMDWFNAIPLWGRSIISAVVIILSTVIILKVGIWILRKVLKKWLNVPIIYPTIKSAWYVIVYIYAISMFLQYVLRISPTTLLATIGISGLTIGVALQGFLKDIAAGVILLATRSFSVGDDVIVKNTYKGIVHRITLVHTHLKTNEGKDIYIANSEMNIVEINSKGGQI